MLIACSAGRRTAVSRSHTCRSCRLHDRLRRQCSQHALIRTEDTWGTSHLPVKQSDELPHIVPVKTNGGDHVYPYGPSSGSHCSHIQGQPTFSSRRLPASSCTRVKKLRITEQGTRLYHTATNQEHGHIARPPPHFNATDKHTPPSTNIRAQLRRWQELHGNDEDISKESLLFQDNEDPDELSNDLSRLSGNASLRRQAEKDEEEREAVDHFARADAEGLENDATDPRFFTMGDLVEIEFPSSEKEGLIAVYVRKIDGLLCQFFTMQGRWLHLNSKAVQHSIPKWISPEEVMPILKYLPDAEQALDADALRSEAEMSDLSVPRHVSARLVSRLSAFYRESMDVYRKNASVLDNAHNMLAHEEDLRYGSLLSAASTLLRISPDKVSVAALFAVRKALMQAGFAFNIDRRSHRVTGYLQIRSKEQVQGVERVRRWLRQWQDDLAATSIMSVRQLARHKPTEGGEIVQRFIEKTKKVVLRNRETREPSLHGNVGPSKIKRAVTPEQDAVKIKTDNLFSSADTEIIRFMEAWACNGTFVGHPRIEALPPLILQATGLYDKQEGRKELGYVFLQEVGTLMPYENRVRFDEHLLLPTSQHSRPLQNLMTQVASESNVPPFVDSMKELRRDWGDMPVYCIDDASALEIDDGISLERVDTTDDSRPEWWVHVHIANPTAFFNRDHPVAKMARHMGESIYMPERSYMMFPSWVTRKHFSLARGRPCLTVSARMNSNGDVLERKIQSGKLQNVIRLTKEAVGELLGLKVKEKQEKFVLAVGGELSEPTYKPRQSKLDDSHAETLGILQSLAMERQKHRRAAGGLFFESNKPEVAVQQSWGKPGLGWDHPYRHGSRTVEGDPVIQLRTQKLRNWFTAEDDTGKTLVQEMMLLASEIAASWCAERKIPIIYRGTVSKPETPDPAVFYRDVCEPAMQKNGGELPLHIGISYVRTLGSVILTSQPLKHRLLGLDHYGKVTSPLRRYGDMILHWQIEAALREEAHRGQSLVTSDPKADRSFLPFSRPVLNTIMVGLQPREAMITRAKMMSQDFWITMLLFRAHHYGETKLPFETCRVVVMEQATKAKGDVQAILVDLNITIRMPNPELSGLEPSKPGDVWECLIDSVNPYLRMTWVKPLRLERRWDA